jgi:hypothetical protein
MLDAKPKAPPVLSVSYDATVAGWKKFGQEAALAHRAGYKLEYVVPLGKQSFGALWFLAHADPQRYGSFDPEDVGLGGVEDL